jgi:MFS family permease
LLLYVPSLPIWGFIALIVIVGYASGAMIIGFAFAKESVPPPLAGTVSGVCNMGVMLGPMILQPLMGWMLDLNWNGALENGVRIYTLTLQKYLVQKRFARSISGHQETIDHFQDLTVCSIRFRP